MGARQYRGANYQVNIVDTEIFSEEMTGKYRGIPWVIRRVKGIVNRLIVRQKSINQKNPINLVEKYTFSKYEDVALCTPSLIF
ncbi:MAG: DUF4278 domain-containing protein [Cyanobacteria bacterium P01_D01_bin.50]